MMNASRLKPLVRALRLRPVQSRVHTSLSRHFEESIFRCAQVLSEGYCRQHGDGEATYAGSTMLTVELDRLGLSTVDELGQLEPAALARVMEGSVRLRIRATRLALAEASRRCVQGRLGTAQIETRVRLDGKLLHVDVELEAAVFQHAVGQRKG